MGKDITINYYQAVHVAKVVTNLAPYATIQGAINAITDASASKRYAILIHPGTYTEAVTLADFIDLIGAGDRDEVVITQAAGTALTAGAITCNLKNITVTDTSSGVCLAVTADGTISCENCEFNSDTDAITMVNGSLSLNNCHVTDGDIELSAAACTLSMDHTEMVGGNLNAADTFVHIISCVYCDFHGNDLDNNADGAGSLIVRNCANIGTLDDHFVTDGYTTTIENSVINTAATKNGTVAWVIKDCYLEDIQNKDATGSVTISGGYVKQCTDSTGDIYWWHDNGNELMVISGMKVEHAITAASSGDTIKIGQGTFAESNLVVDKSINFIGEGLEESDITADSAANPIFLVGDVAGPSVVTCTFQGLTISNTATATTGYGLELDAGTENTTVVVRECFLDGYDAAVHVADGGGGTQTFEAFESSFFATTTCIDVDDTGHVADIDIHNCEVTGGAFADLVGAAHTLDVWDTECGSGAITGDANAPVVNLTRCNDVGTITNAGAGNWVIEHCTTGNIGTTSTGDITIENSNVGTLTQTNAGGAMLVYNSYVTEANPTDGDMDFYECYIATVNSGGGTIEVHGGNIAVVTAVTGSVVWWEGDQILKVMASTVNMLIAHAITAASAGDTIKIGQGSWAEALAVTKSLNFIGEGLEESQIILDSEASPIFLVGDITTPAVVTCTFQGLTISNTATAVNGYGLELDADTQNTTVVVRECFIDGYSAAVHVAVGGGGTQTFEAFESSFFATTTCIDVDDTGAIADIDIHNCEITGGAFADLAGAAHTLDVWDTECGGGAVTGDGSNPAVNLTRCNDVGTITNAGTAGFVIEHCTTGNIALTNDGDVTIENSNVGILSDTDADADAFVYNSYVTKAAPTLGDMTFYSCEIAEIDASGGTVTVHGGNIQLVSVSTGAIVWWEGDRLLKVMASTANMKIFDALAAAGSGDTIMLGHGTFAESNLNAVDGADIVGEGPDISRIVATNNTNAIIEVGNNVNITLRNLYIENAGTANAIDIAAGDNASSVRLENCHLVDSGASGEAVTLTTSAAGAPSLVAFDTLFDGKTTCIEISGAQVANVDCDRCRFATGAAITSTGATHTIDVLDTDFAARTITVTVDAAAINLTRCNDVGAISNLTSTLTIENCSTGNITTTTGAVTIENSNIGIFVSANVTCNVYSSYVAEANPSAGIQNYYDCYIADVDCAGGAVRIYGGTPILVSNSTGVVYWKTGAQVYEVLNGMDIGDAITAATNETPTDTFRFTVKVHEGEYNEAVTMAQWVDLVGDSGESCVIYQSGANVIIAAANSRIRNVRVELLAGSDDSAIYVNNVTGVVIEECTITVARTSGNNSGILTAGTGGAEVYRCSIEATAAEDAAIVCQGTGATELYNNDLNGGLADINLNADVTNDLQTYNNNCRGAGFRIVAVDTYNVYAHGDVFDTVTHLLTDSVRGHMFLQNEPNIALVREGMYISDGIALATADTPSAANPWTVLVGAGVYTEQVAMDDYVNLVAEAGYEVTKIKHTCTADDQPTVTMESNCQLEGFGILSDGVTDGGTWRAQCVYSAAKSNWLIKDCLLQQVNSAVANNICVFIDTSGTGMRLEHCRWFSGEWPTATTDDIKRGLQVDAAGIEVLLQDCETYGEDYDFYLNEGKVETRNCMIRGGGWYISDNATSIGLSWDDDWQGTAVSPVTFAGTNGEFADLSGARLYTCTVDETLGEAVYISNPDTVDEATNAAATPLPAEGIIVYKPSTTTAYVKKHGYVYLADPGTLIGVAFTAGGNIWLGATGAWLAAAPSNAIKQILGVAKGPGDGAAAKEFLIDISLVVIETASFADHTPTGGVLSIPIAWGAGSAATGTHISNNARRAVAIVNAAGQTVFSQAVDIPSDYLHDAANNKLFAVLFPTGGAATDIDWTAYTCCASHGEDEAFHSDSDTADDQDVTDDQILFLDISTAFLTTYTAEEGDVLSIELIIDAMDAPVTQVNVLEFKLIYTRQV